MLPVIAIVGRPNVGKSTLFNRITCTRNALVGNIPGLTRDRQYGEGRSGELRFIVIDTGGLNIEQNNLAPSMTKQAKQAIAEADWVLFLVDARSGLTFADETIARMLRRLNKNIYLTLNKIDGLNQETALTDFYSLGLGAPHPISAEHGLGVKDLISKILTQIPDQDVTIASHLSQTAHS